MMTARPAVTSKPLAPWVVAASLVAAAVMFSVLYRPWEHPARRWDVLRDTGCAAAVGLVLGQGIDVRRRRRQQLQLQRRTEKQLTAIEDFLYIAAHDLKEPLRSMGYQLQLLDQDLRCGAAPDRRVRALDQLVGRSLQMVHDLLDYAATSAEPPQPDTVRLLPALGEAVARFETSPQSAPVTVRWSGSPLAEAAGDERLLVEVLANLVGNALKFSTSATSHAAAVSPKAACEPAPRSREPTVIDVGLLPLAEPTLFVRDRGIGLPADVDRETIFQPFRRLHAPSQYPGTGLGLSLVRRLVAAHGGRVWVEDTPGGGATFLFTLAPAPHAATVARRSVPAPYLRRSRRGQRATR